eukprot:30873-Pelagococcus_subviridis.AAC.1
MRRMLSCTRRLRSISNAVMSALEAIASVALLRGRGRSGLAPRRLGTLLFFSRNASEIRASFARRARHVRAIAGPRSVRSPDGASTEGSLAMVGRGAVWSRPGGAAAS